MHLVEFLLVLLQKIKRVFMLIFFNKFAEKIVNTFARFVSSKF